MLRWSGHGATHVGLVRTGNEDSGFVGPTCLLVADGVGGAAAGEIASATTAYVVSALALQRREDDPAEVLDDAVRAARREVARGVEEDPGRTGMASTLTALVTDGRSVGLAHVGDSRGYLFREGELTRLTRDDTFVQELLDTGQIEPGELGAHPWRNVVTNTISAGPGLPADIRRLDLTPGDRLLLATDGLTDLVDDARIAAILAGSDDEAATRGLVEAALAAGGRDNVTCVVATLVEGPPLAGDGRLLGAVQDPANVVNLAGVRAG